MTADGGLADRLAAVRAAIGEACHAAGRAAEDVRLVAVTKTVLPAMVEEAAAAGIADFGENRAVELARKATEVRAPGIVWHYLGRLQTGTVKHVVRHAAIVHSGEPGTALETLGRRLHAEGRVIPVLLEVDFTGRRVGIRPDRALDAAARVSAVPGVALRGLMTVAPSTPIPEGARPFFRRLGALRDRLAERFPQAIELSMGMSADYTIAVEEGATMVRVGTAIFGQRPGDHA